MSNEVFEKWLGSDQAILCTAMIRTGDRFERDIAKLAWQAAKANSEREIALLKVKIGDTEQKYQEKLNELTENFEELELNYDQLNIDYCLVRDNRDEKIKQITNAPAIEQGEPVAWIDGEAIITKTYMHYGWVDSGRAIPDCWIPLYTVPPQKQWVRLSDEDKFTYENQGLGAIVEEVEAKLKELNDDTTII